MCLTVIGKIQKKLPKHFTELGALSAIWRCATKMVISILSDRKSNMIISGGENVYPSEVEGVLGSHPKVKDVAVLGRTP